MASYATSYITPSLTQLFGAFGANADLEAEDNRTVETGVEYALGSTLRANLLYFNRNEKNAVIFDNVAFQYFNAGTEIEAQGAEAELHWRLLRNLSLDINYTFTERKGDNAIRIPKHKINALLGYRWNERTFTSLNYRHTGQRFDTDFATFSDVELKPFSQREQRTAPSVENVLELHLAQDTASAANKPAKHCAQLDRSLTDT